MEPRVEIKKGGLNEYQKRHLRITCQYVDKLLSDIEATLNSSASKAAFPVTFSTSAPHNAAPLRTTSRESVRSCSACSTAKVFTGSLRRFPPPARSTSIWGQSKRSARFFSGPNPNSSKRLPSCFELLEYSIHPVEESSAEQRSFWHGNAVWATGTAWLESGNDISDSLVCGQRFERSQRK